MAKTVSVEGADNRMDEAVAFAEAGEHVYITRGGEVVAVMIGFQEYTAIRHAIAAAQTTRPDWGDDPSY